MGGDKEKCLVPSPTLGSTTCTIFSCKLLKGDDMTSCQCTKKPFIKKYSNLTKLQSHGES